MHSMISGMLDDLGLKPAALSAVAVSQAAIVNFDLSPAGAGAALGLSPLNEVPVATNSTTAITAATVKPTLFRLINFLSR